MASFCSICTSWFRVTLIGRVVSNRLVEPSMRSPTWRSHIVLVQLKYECCRAQYLHFRWLLMAAYRTYSMKNTECINRIWLTILILVVYNRSFRPFLVCDSLLVFCVFFYFKRPRYGSCRRRRSKIRFLYQPESQTYIGCINRVTLQGLMDI